MFTEFDYSSSYFIMALDHPYASRRIVTSDDQKANDFQIHLEAKKRVSPMLRPIQVKALPDYRLWVKYADGVEGEVDLSHLVGKGVFSLWNDYRAFEQVYIGSSGQIAWTDEIDICPDAVYMRIIEKTPEELFPSLQFGSGHRMGLPASG